MTCEQSDQQGNCILLIKSIHGPFTCHKPGQGGTVGYTPFTVVHGYNRSCERFSTDYGTPIKYCQYPEQFYSIIVSKFFWNGGRWVSIGNIGGGYKKTLENIPTADDEQIIYDRGPSPEDFPTKGLCLEINNNLGGSCSAEN